MRIFWTVAGVAALIGAGIYVWSSGVMIGPSATRGIQTGQRTAIAAVEAETVALFRKSAPSVVHVFAQPPEQVPSTDDAEQQSHRSGSGFIWDGAGHIVTNEHVLRGAELFRIRLAGGELRQGRVVGAQRRSISPSSRSKVVTCRQPYRSARPASWQSDSS